jgi:hypothetical protein
MPVPDAIAIPKTIPIHKRRRMDRLRKPLGSL